MLGGPAAATTVLPPATEEMLDTADAVVLATVAKIESVAAVDGSRIATDITLRVHEGYKGAKAGDEIVLREVGGAVGGERQWLHGAPEYGVGETVLAFVKRAPDGSLRTHHLGLGKRTAEIARDGRVWLRGAAGSGGRKELLSRFVKSLPKGMARAARVRADAPRLEGIAQAQTAFRLMEPASRWFDAPIQVWGDLAGDRGLGAASSRRAVSGAAAAWNAAPGSDLDLRYSGEKTGEGFRCTPGRIEVSFGDVREEVDDPNGCSSGALAVGGFCASGSPVGNTGFQRITAAAVVVNDGWEGCWFWNEKNIAEVLTHEIGHAIGLAHSWDGHLGATSDRFIMDATMFWTAHFDGRGAALESYDRGAVAWLYEADTPAATPTPRPTATPRPTVTPRPVQTPRPQPTPPDRDRDGVADTRDNCPGEANYTQVDSDGDGLGDACDVCVHVPSDQDDAACTLLTVRAQLSTNAQGPRIHLDGALPLDVDTRGLGAVRVELEGVVGRLNVRFPARLMQANAKGTWGHAQKRRAALTIRRTSGGSALVLDANLPGVARLFGGPIVVRVHLGAHSAAAQMSCQRLPNGASCASS